MEKYLVIQDKKIFFTIKKNKRSRKVTIVIHSNGEVVVTIPFNFSFKKAWELLLGKKDWFYQKVPYANNQNLSQELRHKDYLAHKELARHMVIEKINHFNRHYNLPIKRIAIRKQRTRWGSCSSKGNLNFNYKIAKLSSYLADYIVVHELCHLKELNHSHSFWALVSETLPNYKQLRQEIKKIKL